MAFFAPVLSQDSAVDNANTISGLGISVGDMVPTSDFQTTETTFERIDSVRMPADNEGRPSMLGATSPRPSKPPGSAHNSSPRMAKTTPSKARRGTVTTPSRGGIRQASDSVEAAAQVPDLNSDRLGNQQTPAGQKLSRKVIEEPLRILAKNVRQDHARLLRFTLGSIAKRKLPQQQTCSSMNDLGDLTAARVLPGEKADSMKVKLKVSQFNVDKDAKSDDRIEIKTED